MDDSPRFVWHDDGIQAEESDEQSELSILRWELLRIDGKAATLLTLAGAGFALATAVGSRERVADWLLAAGLVPSAVAIVQLLLVVRPHFGNGWPRGATEGQVEASPVERRRSELAVLSLLVLTKYRLLRTAATLLICALALVLTSELTLLLR